MTTLFLLSCLAVAGLAAPLVSYLPGYPSYSLKYAAPYQTREEHRDALGVRGSYSVRYPHGGLLTQTYRYPSHQAYSYPSHQAYSYPTLLRTTAAGPLGPTGTIVSLRNSKAGSYLLEMLSQRLDERVVPIVTRTNAVLVEAAPPLFINSKLSPLLTELRLESEATGGLRELQLRDPGDAVVVDASVDGEPGEETSPFVNSKVSPALHALRRESLRRGALAGRAPESKEGPDSLIVEAASL